MPQHDPINVLISQGYPPEVAKQMVESGTYETMAKPLPGLSALGLPTGAGTAQAPPLDFGAEEEITPEIQQLLDQGYTLEEAKQLVASGSYAPSLTADAVKTGSAESGPVDSSAGLGVQKGVDTIGGLLNIAGSGVSLEQAAYGLGQSIGAEKGAGRTLGIIGGVGKLALGTARGIAGGIGQEKRSQYVQDYYDKLAREEGTGRTTYTPAPQAGNVNYLGGSSYGEDGGIQGETLPIKAFLKSGGFKKPGYKKLM